MNSFLKIIDFVFPLMPPGNRVDNIAPINPDSIIGDDNTLQKKTKAAKQYYDEEKERVKTIEGKASMFITSSGFLGTVLIGTSNILIGQEDAAIWIKVLMVICLLFFVIYMVSTVLRSIIALERTKFCRPDPTTLINISDNINYDKHTISDLLNATIFNQDTANRKMDNVVIAQRYFKRLLFSVLAFVVVLMFYVFNKNGLHVLSWLHTFKEELSNWSLNIWCIIILSVFTLIALTLGIVALSKIQKIKGEIGKYMTKN